VPQFVAGVDKTVRKALREHAIRANVASTLWCSCEHGHSPWAATSEYARPETLFTVAPASAPPCTKRQTRQRQQQQLTYTTPNSSRQSLSNLSDDCSLIRRLRKVVGELAAGEGDSLLGVDTHGAAEGRDEWAVDTRSNLSDRRDLV
jgi:hypothetical protein